MAKWIASLSRFFKKRETEFVQQLITFQPETTFDKKKKKRKRARTAFKVSLLYIIDVMLERFLL